MDRHVDDLLLIAQTTERGSGKHQPNSAQLDCWLLLYVRAGTTYGYAIRNMLTEHGLEIDRAVLYRALRRMAKEGLMESSWTSSTKGPDRRSYRMTQKGDRHLEKLIESGMAERDHWNRVFKVYEGKESSP